MSTDLALTLPVAAPTASDSQHPIDPETVRAILARFNADLMQVEDGLRQLAELLPQTGDGFDPLTELAAGVTAIRSDLLQDAIDTLRFLSSASEDELHRSHEQRLTSLASWT